MENSNRSHSEDSSGDIKHVSGEQALGANIAAQNLSWSNYLRAGISAYLLSPRMWPMGYILNSSYSPLQLELEMPGYNWRDSFEDLLALENGSDLIDFEDRKNEDELCKQILLENAQKRIHEINEELAQNHRWLLLTDTFRKAAVRKEQSENVNWYDKERIPSLISQQEHLISSGKSLVDLARELAQSEEFLGSSRAKSRIHWVSSLITSGAVRGWRSTLANSDERQLLSLEKSENVDDDDDTGITVSQSEVNNHFEEGSPYDQNEPDWSTLTGPYPPYPSIEFQFDDTVVDNLVSSGAVSPPKPPSIRKSILRQIAHTDFVPSQSAGKAASKVHLLNEYTDGTVEKKEIVDDARQVLREVEAAHRNMRDYYRACHIASDRWHLEAFETRANIVDNDDLD